MQAQINPFLWSHCLAEDLSPEWGWAYLTPVGINHIPPPHIPLSICSQLLLGSLPSPPTAKTAAAINNVQTLSIAHLSSHLASYRTHPCYAKQKGILAPATSRWRMDKGTSKIDRKQEIDYKQAGDRKRVFSDTSVQTKGICLSEATVANQHSPRAHFEQCSMRYLNRSFCLCYHHHLCSSQRHFPRLWVQTLSQIFNCSNLVRLPEHPSSKDPLIAITGQMSGILVSN